MDILSGRFNESNIFINKAQGAWLYDINNKKYVDFLLGNCCNILGHSHPRVIEAIIEQVKNCTNIGDHKYRNAYNLAEKILKLSNKDALRFVNSGSEAVHLALRLARSYTNRSLIIKFWGHYHGWFMEEIKSFVPEIPYPKGLLSHSDNNIIAINWNSKEEVDAVFEKYSKDIAAVICEPVLCHAGPIPPLNNFLNYLREKTKSNKSILIFDECITGLRLAPGGAQAFFNVNADIVIYSKAFSAGLPIGIRAGEKTIMELLEKGETYQAATYDANPISIVAANAVVDIVLEEKPHEKIEKFGNILIKEISNIYNEYKITHIWQGYPSVFQFYKTDLKKISNHSESLSQTDTKFYSMLVDELLINGINLYKGDIRSNPNSSWLSQWFVSASHGDEEINWTLIGLKKSLEKVLKKDN